LHLEIDGGFVSLDGCEDIAWTDLVADLLSPRFDVALLNKNTVNPSLSSAHYKGLSSANLNSSLMDNSSLVSSIEQA